MAVIRICGVFSGTLAFDLDRGVKLRAVVRLARKSEAIVGIMCAALVGTAVVGFAFYLLVPDSHRYPPHIGWIVAGAIIAGAAEVVLFFALIFSLDLIGVGPFAPLVALRLSRLPVLLRPVVATWWAAHFAMGLFLAYVVEAGTAGANFSGEPLRHPGWVGQFTAFVAVGLTYAFASNLYAMLTLTALGFGRRTVFLVWRWRILLDVAVAIAASLAVGNR